MTPPKQRLTIPRLLVVTFAALIAAGTILLLLPGMAPPDSRERTVVDALFTSTSAACVTGLTVRDTGSEFSFAGQLAILALIQIGGLGILTFTNALILARGKRIGLSGRMIVEQTHGLLPAVSPARLLRDIVAYTFAIELCGAAILALRFRLGYGIGLARALWLGLFHAVAAFCNAGFGLFSNSLIDYNRDWAINATIMGLIILGGIGFVVFADAGTCVVGLRHIPRPRLSLHSRTVLRVSLILIVGGAALLFLLELTGQAMAGSTAGRALQSLFLSVTARTAGFNSVETSQLTNASLLVVMLLMLVGGSPGSTAGGIKTTTLATLYALLASHARNRPKVELLNRRLRTEVVAKALVTTAGFLLVAMVAVVLLQVTELSGQPQVMHRGRFLEYLFEVVSALDTVGLSTGVTAGLSDPGKIIIILCMFLGRLGPVLVAASLIGKRPREEYSLPEEDLIVG
jgi:trk system potassium uptake protein TrkH